MPLLNNNSRPLSKDNLPIPAGKPLYVIFISSKDPDTNAPWCPDVRASLPLLNATFDTPNGPSAIYEEVGQKPEWKDQNNAYRLNWKISSIPSVVRYELRDGKVEEAGRLEEAEVVEQGRLQGLISQ